MTPLRPAARIARIVGLGQTRSLHMTGVNTYASKLLASTDGKTSSSSAKQSATSSSYPFNVSRSMKTVKDSSTVDFAFLPDVASIEPSRSQPLRVPRVDFMSGAEAEQSTDQVSLPLKHWHSRQHLYFRAIANVLSFPRSSPLKSTLLPAMLLTSLPTQPCRPLSRLTGKWTWKRQVQSLSSQNRPNKAISRTLRVRSHFFGLASSMISLAPKRSPPPPKILLTDSILGGGMGAISPRPLRLTIS